MDIIGTEGDDNFDNSIEGTDASERIFGLGGEDWFVASLGNDTLDGGASNQDVVFYDFNDSMSSVFINNTGGEIDGVAAFTFHLMDRSHRLPAGPLQRIFFDLPPRNLKPPQGYGFRFRGGRSCATRHPRTRDFITDIMSCGPRSTGTRFCRAQCVSGSVKSSSRRAKNWVSIVDREFHRRAASVERENQAHSFAPNENMGLPPLSERQAYTVWLWFVCFW